MKKIFLLLVCSPFLIFKSDGRKKSVFLDSPGTFIHSSQDSGFIYLANLAQTDEKELFLVFLPKTEEWVTMTKKRDFATALIDIDLLDSLVSISKEIELWHNHNDVGIDFSKVEDSLFWIVPSPGDLSAIYHCLRIKNNIKVTGFVVSKYGVMSFTADSTILAPNFVSENYIFDYFPTEVQNLQYIVKTEPLEKLPESISMYNGMFDFTFKLL